MPAEASPGLGWLSKGIYIEGSCKISGQINNTGKGKNNQTEHFFVRTRYEELAKLDYVRSEFGLPETTGG